MPKISGRTLAEHRANTRRALFDALAKLMAERGFDAVSMSDLAIEAGIGRTAIYNHFADKESLLLAFVDEEFGEYLRKIEESLETTDEPTTRLRLFVRSQLLAERQYLAAPGPPLKDVISTESAQRIRHHVHESSKLLGQILRDCIEAGVIPPQDVHLTVQLVNGTITGRRVPKVEPERSAFFETTERFVLQACGATLGPVLPDIGPIPAPRECESESPAPHSPHQFS